MKEMVLLYNSICLRWRQGNNHDFYLIAEITKMLI